MSRHVGFEQVGHNDIGSKMALLYQKCGSGLHEQYGLTWHRWWIDKFIFTWKDCIHIVSLANDGQKSPDEYGHW